MERARRNLGSEQFDELRLRSHLTYIGIVKSPGHLDWHSIGGCVDFTCSLIVK